MHRLQRLLVGEGERLVDEVVHEPALVMMLIGVYENGEGPSALLTLPEAAWELSLGIYCAWKGFRLASPLAQAQPAPA
jgi:hypothetical protein